MSDLYELQLSLDLPDTLPASDLALLHWHLGENSEELSQDGPVVEELAGSTRHGVLTVMRAR